MTIQISTTPLSGQDREDDRQDHHHDLDRHQRLALGQDIGQRRRRTARGGATGRNWAADTMPSQSGSPPVSSRTSHAWATCCIQVPTRETAWPAKKSR